MNPLNWDGPTFLVFYGLALIVAIPLAWIIGRIARPAGRTQVLSDADSLAYLAGRDGRFAEGVASRSRAANSAAARAMPRQPATARCLRFLRPSAGRMSSRP
jgi:hypothetical protein